MFDNRMILTLIILLTVAVLAGVAVGYGLWGRRKATNYDGSPLALLDALQDRPVVSGKLVIDKCVRQTPNSALTGAEGVRVEGTVMQQTEE